MSIGSLRDGDNKIARGIADLLGGRGLLAMYHPHARKKAWERFAFAASAAATAALAGRSLRDSFRFAHGLGNFSNLLREAFRIGIAAGFAPDLIAVRDYEKSVTLEGRPIQAPEMISAGGRAGDESACLPVEMIEVARRARVNTIMYEMAWRTVTRTTTRAMRSDILVKSA